MASFNNSNYPGAPSFESLLIQNLMGELQIRPSSLDASSFLSQTLDDLLLQDDPLSPGGESDEAALGGGGRGRSLLAREEAKLEKEIIRVIRSGAARESLKPNSGQSVSIGDHNVCVGFHEEPGSEYRVWEWHGHVMLFDDEDGFCPEYVYGNYFERVPLSAGSKEGGGERGEEKDACARLRELIGEKDEEVGKEKGAYSGLRELIADDMGTAGNGGQRVLHRNSLSHGLGK
ncbi:hypothetical protein Taro_019840 [Colocasia esculenta]|uniref:Uncharacterized protein n=1 Tax=Colocasia esculenta TaxID=4460 RepID=A0A843V0I9_COLES|nr:hypothetical protein [Colocasia esculenta]